MSLVQYLSAAVKVAASATSIVMAVGATTPAQAQRALAAQQAPRAAPAAVSSPAVTPSPRVAFNRANFGPQSGVSPGLLRRAYRAYDAMQSPGGARGAGLRAGQYRNDARNGEAPLPRTTPTGAPITYQRVNLRPGGHARSHAQARAVVGSDKSVWVSRHYGQDGGKVKRVQ